MINVTLKEIVDTVNPLATLGGIVFVIYRTFRDPDIKMDKDVGEMKKACELKHLYLDKEIKTINENHLTHIESDIKVLSENQAKIFQILEDRLPGK